MMKKLFFMKITKALLYPMKINENRLIFLKLENINCDNNDFVLDYAYFWI